MQYAFKYASPLGEIVILSDGEALTMLNFHAQKYAAEMANTDNNHYDLPIFRQTKQWLDCYFSGENPGELPALRLVGTPFRVAVWNALLTIPYGETTTYGEIAAQIARQKGLSKMSAQAIGGAVGHNPISIIVPCHRVIGSDGNLTGYASGLNHKVALLKNEHIDMSKMFLPKH